ncbi:hypothetical protein [Bacillus sp. B-jedd]|uniref:hypothetical protein n=1 Tax=Bacillus sp. B-jedd TaxID=1476857 RepID=UPI000515689B|nr:hypothetical protein [Bacillus sp. B-jedd]CEG29449.1 ABC transporter ATP-binding protein/permease [Bacillus sp. B-jedd]
MLKIIQLLNRILTFSLRQNQINSVIETYPKGVVGFRRYLDLLNTAPAEKDNLNATDVKNLIEDIEYKGVTFGYKEKE